ncbi:MAG: AI-2E family transporter [Gammaproteobacteria bacterium]
MKTLNVTAIAVLVIAIFYVLIVGEALLLPLVVAVALWYLINLLASGFQQFKLGGVRIPWSVCLLASILTFVALGWAVVNFIGSRIADVRDVIPTYQANIEARIRNLPFSEYLMDEETGDLSGFLLDPGWLDLPAIFASLASTFTSIVTSGGIIFIYIIFLLLEQGSMDKKISSLVDNPERERRVRNIIKKIQHDIRKYISIKVFTSTLTGVLSYGFLLILDVDFAAVWGLLIFLLNFIPTVGSIIATIFPAVIALAQFEGYTQFVLVLAVIASFQMAIGNFLEPRMMGTSFNLSPLLILLNLGLWGYIWGVVGMFLCVPFLIIVFIVLAHFPQTRPIAVMLSADGNVGFIDDE